VSAPAICRWFAKCTNPAPQQVEHPALGWVNICDDHLAWLGPEPSPTQFYPPLAAAVLDRNPAMRAMILGAADAPADDTPTEVETPDAR
jgi:hypothetical protein